MIKRNADKEQRETIKHKKGDLVWVSGSNINSDQPTNKLAFKRAGPFPVVKKVGSLAYELKILKMWKSLQLVTNLKPYHPLCNNRSSHLRRCYTRSQKDLEFQKMRE